MNKTQISGVVTAYLPQESLRDVVKAALGSCARVVVVDNTPAGTESLAPSLLRNMSNVVLIQSRENTGLAAALNVGISKTDSEFLLLLDQDSAPAPSLGLDLLDVITAQPRCGALGPAPWDEKANRFLDPRTHLRDDLSSLPVIITSAMLLRRRAFDETRGFREDFFVDCVDQDMCLQLRATGWTVLQDKRLRLPHTLGETRWHRVGPFSMRATHHPTWRLYWIARNGVILNREYARTESRWVLTNTLILLHWLLSIVLFEPPRAENLVAFWTGLWDGVFRRTRSRFIPNGASVR